MRRCECCGKPISMRHVIRKTLASTPMTARELAKTTGIALGSIRTALSKMHGQAEPCGTKQESQRKKSYQWRFVA